MTEPTSPVDRARAIREAVYEIEDPLTSARAFVCAVSAIADHAENGLSKDDMWGLGRVSEAIEKDLEVTQRKYEAVLKLLDD